VAVIRSQAAGATWCHRLLADCARAGGAPLTQAASSLRHPSSRVSTAQRPPECAHSGVVGERIAPPNQGTHLTTHGVRSAISDRRPG
jgi:hypothetical protein